ncbi:flagellar hook-associated protein FlgK [Sphingosinicella sp.]|uniref:flagellar hook-associated protein FlgK n=1 Tax=Sphingosinicella sp. TaxID=1917971 RepID=UPI004038270C
MSDLLSIGISGLSAYRNALDAVGENVANSQSPGFTRRRVTLEQSQITSRGDIAYGEQVLFNGVRTAGVVRAWDAFKATEARYATTGAARAAVREQWLTSVENALGDGVAGVGASLTQFFNAGGRLAADPSAPIGRIEMLTALDSVAGALRGSAGGLGRIAGSVADAATADADAVNGAIAALHDLNGALHAAARGGTAGASLADERDRLIERIAERLDIAVAINGDGTATLKSGSDASVVLLDGDRAALFSTVRALDGRVSLQVSTNGTIMPAPVSGGRLAGLVDVAASVADRRAALDALAADIATTLNAWSTGGLDASGAAGGDLLDASGGAAGINVVITDPDRIAAATADGRPNGNLIDLEAVRAASKLEDEWGTIVSGSARQLASAKAEAAASAAWRDLSRAALDEVTGVDLDREAADLLRYQQAYNASARIIQVARETIDALFAAL